MSKDIDLSDSYAILRQAIHFDVKERFEILREEIEHLVRAVAFRTGEQINDTADDSKFVRSSAPNSQSAFLRRLNDSAKQLKVECEADLTEIAAFELAWAKSHLAHVTRSAPKQILNEHECFALIWNAKLHEKSIVIVERLGDLHDRLDQFLQRTNPDHPDPTLRRRSEQGLTDKYLSEFTRWVHRDLVLFAKSTAANYPYQELPSTYQFWAYDRTSRQHAFMPLNAHMAWKRAVESTKSPAPIKEPGKFTTISLSYWTPERPTLVPIIGHELAHQVFRDLYGRELNFVTLEHDGSDIGGMFRRLTGTVEQWLAPRFQAGHTEPKASSYLVQEIMCDCLAAVRFGYAYAYAWVLETISNERFAQMFQDEYGMLRRFVATASPNVGDSSQTNDLEQLQREAMPHSRQMQGSALNMYYRGVVLSTLLEQLGLENDLCAQGLDLGFKRYLELMLHLNTRGDPERAAWESAFARDLASKLVHEWQVDDGDEGYGNSSFLKKAREFWDFRACPPFSFALASPSLRHQQLNNTFRTLVAKVVESRCGLGDELTALPDRLEIIDGKSVRTLTDLTWRLEWLIEMEKRAFWAANPQRIEELRGSLRAVMFLGMDDYLIRTANPVRLFSVLVDQNDSNSNSALDQLSRSTNTLDLDRLEKVYGKKPIETLNDAVKREGLSQERSLVEGWFSMSVLKPRERDLIVSMSGQRIALDSNLLQYLAAPLVDSKLWQRVITGEGESLRVPGQYVLELLKVRGGEGALSRNMRITERQNEGMSSKYKSLCSAALLGRYDAMVLHKQVRQDGQIGWDITVEDPKTGRARKNAGTVSRAKRLVPILRGASPENINENFNLVAVVLVSLKWDASRAIVAKWLSERGLLDDRQGLRIHAFLGDGWEDLVLLASHANVDSVGKSAMFNALTQLIQSLNCNPFVASTETLFTNLILQDPPEAFQFRFAFRVAESGYEAARAAIQKAVSDVFKGILDTPSIQEVAGNKDFEMIVPPGNNNMIKQLHEAFHRSADSCYRVETRTAWTVSPSA